MNASVRIVCLVLLGVSGCAQSIDGKTKVGLEVPLLLFERVKLTDPSEEGNDESIGGELTSTELTIGLATPARASYLAGAPAQLGVDVAHGLSDHVVLGARAGFGFSTFDGEQIVAASDTSFDVLSASLMPHAEYVFAGDSVRPFAGLEAGFGIVSTSAEDNSGSTSTWMGSGGGVLGMHVFLGEGLSFDPRLSIAYGFGSHEQEVLVIGGATPGDLSFEWDVSRWSVALNLGLSAWL